MGFASITGIYGSAESHKGRYRRFRDECDDLANILTSAHNTPRTIVGVKSNFELHLESSDDKRRFSSIYGDIPETDPGRPITEW